MKFEPYFDSVVEKSQQQWNNKKTTISFFSLETLRILFVCKSNIQTIICECFNQKFCELKKFLLFWAVDSKFNVHLFVGKICARHFHRQRKKNSDRNVQWKIVKICQEPRKLQQKFQKIFENQNEIEKIHVLVYLNIQ